MPSSGRYGPPPEEIRTMTLRSAVSQALDDRRVRQHISRQVDLLADQVEQPQRGLWRTEEGER